MIRFLGTRGASAVMGLFMVALASSQANAQSAAAPIQAATANAYRTALAAPVPTPPPAPLVAATSDGRVAMAFPAKSVTIALPAAMPVGGLSALVEANSNGEVLDEEGNCLATAVYFESKGEPLDGQLAVANVVINRARSGRYPPSLCGVVKQKAQFSFVRGGRFPPVDVGCAAWRKAQAIARIAAKNMAAMLPGDVLWYHADYVAPSWGRRLTRVEKIGAHIFYRA